ncbi:spore germination protein [Paenibacillus sp. MER 180]|uniref:GerAB/ArcD/ProY family transporter n=1 Tax=Paenibacillus sp. MER 180 TaxID=2939570 RepID=UPI00203B867B|nr:endospore germination permease [Paenibacillus sp. MER 180]MCM3291106.1 spore germination protein [Paenibacillus sp. MER 180]
MEQGKITWPQLCMLMYLMVCATAVLVIPTVASQIAGRDAWLTSIISSLAGFISLYVGMRLNRYFPDKTMVEYGPILIGRWAGALANGILMFYLLHGAGTILREYGEFIVGSLLLRTPEMVISTVLIFVCAVAIRGGVEVIGKFALIIAPLFMVLLLCIPLFLLPVLNGTEMFPILNNGWKPVLHGSITPATWFLEFVLIGFFLPFAIGKRSRWKWSVAPVILMLITMVVTNLLCLFLFGPLTSMFTFPVFVASRYISLADFFEHVEAIVVVLWVLGGFVQIATWYYMLVLGTAQWLKLKDYRSIIFPLGVLIIAMSFWTADNLQDMVDLFMTTEPLFAATVLLLYPLLLLIIAWWKKRRALHKETRD